MIAEILICTTIGYFFGHRRGKRQRKPKVCPHGLATDAVKCIRCAAASVARR